jgi:HlyD family secretion protein
MKKNWLIVAVAALAIIAILAYRHHAQAGKAPPYRFATVERGDLESVVSATGILSAVTSVQVGTQVSGQIAAMFVDFNDHVKKGQLIARIDPTLAEQAVADAQAGLDRSRAELSRASEEYQRNKTLFEGKVLTEVEFNTAKYAYEVAQADVKSSQVALARAKRNLSYTSIIAPVDGVVIERNMDVGQTVASNYSTPQLFLIAKDLSEMQILASVDESDIGQILNGQKVRFSVQAYPNRTFAGVVKQVRLQSKTTENVVNYTVAVAVENKDGKLLPGMTATVEFLTGAASNVLIVPNAALRFRPPQEELEKSRQQAANSRGESFAAARAAMGDRTTRAPGVAGASGRNGRRPQHMGILWYLDEAGTLKSERVRTGISDGQKTEVAGGELEEGQQVIVGATQTAHTGAGLFQPTMSAGPRR